MFQHQGIWLPDGEKHFPEWMSKNGELIDGRGTYQIRKLREAMKWVRHWRLAVDVGAHVGLWSMQLAARFGHVQAFEAAAKITGKPNEIQGEWRGIGDVALMKDRKES